MSKCRVISLSREFINKKALQIRYAIRAENFFMFPIEKIIEPLIDCLEGRIEILEDKKLPQNIPAQTIFYPNCNSERRLPYAVMQIKESVYLGAVSGNPEDRFTLAHEAGHVFLLHSPIGNNASETNENISLTEDPEWQSDTFAKELLAPSYLFAKFKPDILAKLCKIPVRYAKEQSDYVISNSFFKYIIEQQLRYKKCNYAIKYDELPYSYEQLLQIPDDSPFFRELRIPQYY